MNSWVCKICNIEFDESEGKFFNRVTKKNPKQYFQVYICTHCQDMVKSPTIKRRKRK